MNKKIINATPCTIAGIEFKSKLEGRIYKAIKALGIDIKYETVTYTLSPKIRSKVPFYNKTKVRGFHKMSSVVEDITYTPDFNFKLNGIYVIMEAKGKENDVYPIKRNLFRKQLELLDYPVMFFEVHSKKEALEAIKIVKQTDATKLI